MSALEPRPRPSRRGLTEYLLLVGFLVLACAGAVALFGDEIRAAFGVRPLPGATANRGPGAPAR
ncbi:hypothetical protein [Anaeromyxobacter oryzae]|uniref:Uncharacterized protein n=1 Tax=Anaeromyxobacter oryzae TaxID=2918170 RepID=A0ABM7WXW4_9BACT|nr:hypothetical protein [Anaeromyxobacter oryzae]BDG04346.1 hypothetical protein AMOR_33420 [Anaeromyxobacter oryzae]